MNIVAEVRSAVEVFPVGCNADRAKTEAAQHKADFVLIVNEFVFAVLINAIIIWSTNALFRGSSSGSIVVNVE